MLASLAVLALAVAVTGVRGRPETSGLVAEASPSAGVPVASSAASPMAPSHPATSDPSPTPTTRPSRPSHWEFRPIRLDGLDASASVRGVWALDRTFVAVVDRFESGKEAESVLLTSRDGEIWTRARLPVEGLSIRAGLAQHGTLRIIGRSATASGWAWSHWITWNGATWEQLGPVSGLEDVEDVRHLSRSHFGLLAAVTIRELDGGVDTVREELRYSESGFDWAPRSVPGLGAHASIAGLATNGPRAVVMTNEPTETRQTLVTAWSSEDGRTWSGQKIATLDGEGSTIEGPSWSFPELFSPFALIGYEIAQGSPYPRIWTSVDAASWADADVESPAGGHASAIAAVTYSDGTFQDGLQDRTFIAVAETGGGAWTSKDGVHWWYAQILPAESRDRLLSVAVIDTIVAVAGDSPNGLTIWVGNLKSIPWG